MVLVKNRYRQTALRGAIAAAWACIAATLCVEAPQRFCYPKRRYRRGNAAQPRCRIGTREKGKTYAHLAT